jgi:hypothetical protein
MISILLYCALGVALAACGIDVINKPWQFFMIIAIVMAISISR